MDTEYRNLLVSRALQEANHILDQIPPEAREWAESLPWEQRRYVLSLCHLICAAPPEVQAEFLDEYTADGILSRIIYDRDTQQKVEKHLRRFQIQTALSETILRSYIKQFYIHSAQDVRRKPDVYLESALRLIASTEERNHVFNYILGFELIKMMFKMSWLQHERLYRLQRNQEEFTNLYIKPIQHTHRINGIVVPVREKEFFSKRDYFVQEPQVSVKKLTELVIATFTTDVVTNLGFSIIRHPQCLHFDYEHIFTTEQESLFI
jgi:hypothetical protein